MTVTLPAVPLATVLGFSAVLAALMAGRLRGVVRDYLRFAAALTLALALSELTAGLVGGTAAAFANTVMALVAALAPAALALAAVARLSGPPAALPATAALMAACLAGLVATATGSDFFAFAPLVIAVPVLTAQALRIWPRSRRSALLVALGALALLAAASSDMAGSADGPQIFGLFFAAALLGIALALVRASEAPVEARAVAPPRKALFIRGRR